MTGIRAQVLFLSYDGLTDPLGQSQILPYLIGLSGKGYEFTIISFEKKERFDKGRKIIEGICNSHQLNWIPLCYHKNPPVLSTLYDVIRMRRKAYRVVNERAIGIVHCRSYITALIGMYLKSKCNVKFIFDMRGFWADERVEGGLWRLENPLYRMIYKFFKKKEKDFLINADHVISLTNNAKQEIESWRVSNAPITVIPTCVDLALFDPDKIEKEAQIALREKSGIKKEDYVLLYLGSWGTWYMGDEMLDFFSALKQERPDAKFLIVSADTIVLEGFIYEKDVIITSVPRSLVPLYISLAHLSVSFIKTSFSKKASSATKIGEILAMNIPVITNKGWGDVDEMVKKNSGLLLQSDVNIKNILTPDRNFNSRKYCIQNLSLEYGVTQYRMVYESLN